MTYASRPVWGAWIEMSLLSMFFVSLLSRPVWGAWIEIGLGHVSVYVPITSRPVWGAWIEIRLMMERLLPVISRAPYGARGLKSLITV